MYDYPDQVKELLQQYFSPSEPLFADLKLSTKNLLDFLFRSFPTDSISDYELSEILIDLGYQPHVYVVPSVTGEGEEAVVKNILETGWCLKSYYDLKPE